MNDFFQAVDPVRLFGDYMKVTGIPTLKDDIDPANPLSGKSWEL